MKPFLSSIQGPREYQQDRVSVKFIGKNELLAVIADGVGGHAHGDLAAISVIGAYNDLEAWSLKDLTAAAKTANRVCKNAPDDRSSTVVAVYIKDDQGLIFWAGDSRAYVIEDINTPELVQLTEDHGVGRHIFNSIGFLDTDKYDTQAKVNGLTTGKSFIIITTDGVHDYIGDQEIIDVIQEAVSAERDPAIALTTYAEDHTKDNCSCIVIEV